MIININININIIEHYIKASSIPNRLEKAYSLDDFVLKTADSVREDDARVSPALGAVPVESTNRQAAGRQPGHGVHLSLLLSSEVRSAATSVYLTRHGKMGGLLKDGTCNFV